VGLVRRVQGINEDLSLSRDNMLGFLSTLSIVQPSLRASHEDLGSNFIFEATDKTFPEEGIRHSIHSKSQVFKGRYKFFHCARLLQLGQMTEIVGVSVKAFL
jgi:hypothetical protein